VRWSYSVLHQCRFFETQCTYSCVCVCVCVAAEQCYLCVSIAAWPLTGWSRRESVARQWERCPSWNTRSHTPSSDTPTNNSTLTTRTVIPTCRPLTHHRCNHNYDLLTWGLTHEELPWTISHKQTDTDSVSVIAPTEVTSRSLSIGYVANDLGDP